MFSAANFLELQQSLERCFQVMKEYISGLDARGKLYIELKTETDNSLHFRIGLRNFIILADINPIHKKPRIVFKTFEIIDFIEAKKLVEFKEMELTHFDNDNFGVPLNKSQLQGGYFSNLEKLIYPV